MLGANAMRSRAVSPPGAAAGHLGTEGQRARGDQTGTEQLGACRRDRLPAVNLANPLFGKMSDRTSSKLGMRRPWMVIGLVVGSQAERPLFGTSGSRQVRAFHGRPTLRRHGTCAG